MQGFRTYFHCAWVGLIGLLLACYDDLGVVGIDLKSLVGEFVPVQYVGFVVLGLVVLFGYMRSITNTAPFRSE